MSARATPGASWQPTGRVARAPSPMVTGAASRPTLFPRRPGAGWFTWLVPRTKAPTHSHLSELLAEREGIVTGRTTLRRILVSAGLTSPRRRRPPKHRVRRQRMPREGMLIQLDGSYHRWLGDDRPQFTLLFAVDDATGAVAGALFCDHEDTNSYFRLMQGLIQRRGLPLALYTGRHAVFKHRPEYQPAGTPTQFGRAMEELGIQMIFALSPQAKGRVERTAGTFQDRLITELRLAGATTALQARAVLKQFLPRFNRRFGVPASVLSLLSGPCSRTCAWSRSCASSTAGEWPGQHREVPEAHSAAASRSATPQLCRSGRGGIGRDGRLAAGTA